MNALTEEIKDQIKKEPIINKHRALIKALWHFNALLI